MKTLLFIPIVLLAILGGSYGASLALGWTFHLREMTAAIVICAISGELALVPVTLLRKSDAATVSQAGLAGTVIHMLLTLVLTAIVWMKKLVDQRLFLFLLLAMFWISLIVLVLAMARLVRTAAQRR